MRDSRRGLLFALLVFVFLISVFAIPSAVRFFQSKRELYEQKKDLNSHLRKFNETTSEMIYLVNEGKVDSDKHTVLQLKMMSLEKILIEFEESILLQNQEAGGVILAAHDVVSSLWVYLGDIQNGSANEDDIGLIKSSSEEFNKGFLTFSTDFKKEYWDIMY